MTGSASASLLFAPILLLAGCDHESRPTEPERQTSPGLPSTLLATGGRWSDLSQLDFGVLTKDGGRKQATWSMVNPHARTHHILGVVKSCACQELRITLEGGVRRSSVIVSDAMPKLAVLGAQRVTVEVTIDPTRVSRAIHGRISLVTDDPDNPTVSVELSGSVEPTLALEPEVLELGTLSRGQPLDTVRLVHVRRSDQRPFAILDLRRCPPGLFATFGARNADRTEWDLEIRVLGLDVEGPYREQVEFVLDDGSTAAARVQAEVPYSIRTSPAGLLHLGTVSRGGAARGTIEVDALDGRDLSGLTASFRWLDGDEPQFLPGARIRADKPGKAKVEIAIEDRSAGGPDRLLRGAIELRHTETGFRRSIHVTAYLRL